MSTEAHPHAGRTVLITGCSAGGLGYGLAQAFHARGLKVLATARNLGKMKDLEAMGITTLELDVLSDQSIAACVSQVSQLTGGSLDILINKAKELFDLNVWSYITVTQAFLPLIIKAKGLIVNQTSISSVEPTPFSSVYHASKAAAAAFSDHQRIELKPFGVRVVDLKTGCVKTNFHSNRLGDSRIPEGSIYEPMREEANKALSGAHFNQTEELGVWASNVADDLLMTDPPARIWRGKLAWSVWFRTTFGTATWFDKENSKMVGLDKLAAKLQRN
jgi:1-acylglycerone phosphate reductase